MRLTINLKDENKNLYFGSDFHLDHRNIIKYDNRKKFIKGDFYDINHMNKYIIDKWNSIVSDDDIVIYLGDFAFTNNDNRFNELCNSLKGKIYYVLGNHDKYSQIKQSNRFENIYDYLELKVIDNLYGINNFVIFHYPIYEWNKCHRGYIHLHGHTHHNIKDVEYYQYKVFDIGCNKYDYSVINYKDILIIANNKKIKGHHEK